MDNFNRQEFYIQMNPKNCDKDMNGDKATISPLIIFMSIFVFLEIAFKLSFSHECNTCRESSILLRKTSSQTCMHINWRVGLKNIQKQNGGQYFAAIIS